MPALLDLLYREFCRARLAEMRKQLLISVESHEVPASNRNAALVASDETASTQTEGKGAFAFTCPIANLKVQHWLDDDVPESEYKGFICRACAKLHFVNRKTGELLRSDEEYGGASTRVMNPDNRRIDHSDGRIPGRDKRAYTSGHPWPRI